MTLNLNWNIPTTKNTNALIAVAHPDDETIFCGGIMLTYPNWKWTVISFTWAENSERIRQVQEAIELFKCLGVNVCQHLTLGQKDTGNLSEDELLSWRNEFQRHNFSPDVVFTHNTRGEYGHQHHISVNKIIHQLYSNVWEFICPGAKVVNPQPYKAKTNKIPLSTETFAKKMEIFNRCYRSEQYLWGALSDVMDYEFKRGPEIFTSG